MRISNCDIKANQPEQCKFSRDATDILATFFLIFKSWAFCNIWFFWLQAHKFRDLCATVLTILVLNVFSCLRYKLVELFIWKTFCKVVGKRHFNTLWYLVVRISYFWLCTPSRHRSGVFIVNTEQILYFFLVFLLLNLNSLGFFIFCTSYTF